MRKATPMGLIATASSTLSVIFSVFLALGTLGGHLGTSLASKTLVVALALVFEASKFAFAAESVDHFRKGTKMGKIGGTACALMSLTLFVLSTIATVAYVQRASGEAHEMEVAALQKKSDEATAKSEATTAARAMIAAIGEDRAIITRQIASTQDLIDRDLGGGYRTRAAQGMERLESLKKELRMLNGNEAAARAAITTSHQGSVSQTLVGVAKPSDTMASVLGVVLELISLLSVIVATTQHHGTGQNNLQQNSAPFFVPQQDNAPPVMHSDQPKPDIPQEVLAMSNPNYRTIQTMLGCTQKRAQELARNVKAFRAQAFQPTSCA